MMSDLDSERTDSRRVREALREVSYPGFRKDIVSAGFVREIQVQEGLVTIHFCPDTNRDDKVLRMQQGIESAVSALPGVKEVCVVRIHLDTAPVLSKGGTRRPGRDTAMTPLQAEVLEDGILPQPDGLLGLQRPDVAPRDGYGESGPRPLDGPGVQGAELPDVPVYQWDIDPADPQARSAEAYLVRDGWEYNMWWQFHPQGLVYASLQALSLARAAEEAGRPHPLGRNVAVNLVYDLNRQGVVAVYGTARDFRPFVQAFLEGFSREETADE